MPFYAVGLLYMQEQQHAVEDSIVFMTIFSAITLPTL